MKRLMIIIALVVVSFVAYKVVSVYRVSHHKELDDATSSQSITMLPETVPATSVNAPSQPTAMANSAISDVSQQVAALQSQSTNVNEQLGQINASVASVSTAISNITTTLTALSSSVDALSGEISQIQSAQSHQEKVLAQQVKSEKFSKSIKYYPICKTIIYLQ